MHPAIRSCRDFSNSTLATREDRVLCDKIKKPSDCSQKDIDDFYELVLKGGQVEPAGLKERIRRRGRLLAFHYDENDLVGVVGLKKPNEGYKEMIFRKAGVPEEKDNYVLEVGWAFTMKAYRGRGICPRLIHGIFDSTKSQSFFATAHLDNISVHRVLEKTGFKKIGEPYRGRTGEFCQLFTISKHARTC
jgi:RimJ/RimL family protein N-acetyltransferase